MDDDTRENGISNETTPLLGGPKTNTRSSKRLQTHLTNNISRKWGDIVLLSCYLITGLLDSSAVFIWGAFVSMQTGNTVYLGLGLGKPSSSTRWIKSIFSICFFCLGSLFFSTYHRLHGPRRRWVLLLSFFIQLILIILAALIVTFTDPVPPDSNELHWQVLVPLSAVAFQSAGQAVTSRVLQYSGLTSVVLTSNYCDLFSDPGLFTSGWKENVQRNRRIAAPVLLLLGAVGGGFFAHGNVGMEGALWAAAVLKAAVLGAWVFWPAEVEEEEE